MAKFKPEVARRPAPLIVMTYDEWDSIQLCPLTRDYVFMKKMNGGAKTAAQRQAARKARELAAGRVHWKRWVHHDDVPTLTECADKLQRKRSRIKRAP
jgi:hypothetical protein